MSSSVQRPARQRRSFLLFLIPLLLLWAVPVVAFLVAVPLAGSAEKADVAVGTGAGTVSVGSRMVDRRQAVDAVFTFGPTQKVSVPASGILTSIDVQTGEKITRGAQIASVDGSPVFASVGGVPIYRDVSARMHGPDVEAVATLLAARGHLALTDVDDEVGPRIRAAISAFQKSIGAPVTGVFSASNATYVPASGTIVSSVLGRVGGTVSAGGDLFEIAGAPQSVALKASGTGASLVPLADAPLAATVGGESADLAGLTPTGQDLASFYEFVSSHGTASDAAQQTSPDSATFGGVLLALRDPIRVGTVPAAAVYTSPSGELCLFVADAGEIVAVTVDGAEPLSGELGIVAVAPDLVGKDVVADASSAPQSVRKTCG